MQASRGWLRILFFAANHLRCRKPCLHVKNRVVEKWNCRVCTEALWNKYSSYPLRVFLLFSSGILRETFLKPSGAPEELPKDVQRNPEADTKPSRTLNAERWTQNAFLIIERPICGSNGFMRVKNKFYRGSVHTLQFLFFMITYLCNRSWWN